MSGYLTRSSSTTNNVHRIHSDMKETVEERMAKLVEQVDTLRARLNNMAVLPIAPEPEPDNSKKARVAATKRLLDERGSLLVADVRSELHVSLKTATRIMHAVSLSGAGVLAFEPAGNTERLRLYHPSKVLLQKD